MSDSTTFAADDILIERLDDVPRARHFATERLRAHCSPDLVDLVQLVTTELVTNALLHAAPPIRLFVTHTGAAARISVADGSPTPPTTGGRGDEEMTGRGMTLVAALATRWGTVPDGTGKRVWCELAEPLANLPEPEAPVVPFDEVVPEPAPSGAQLRLVGLPVSLLLAAVARVDDLLRELALAGSPASSTTEPTLPDDVIRRVERATAAFAPTRQALKRQAQLARTAGAGETDVLVPIEPPTAEQAVEFLASLEEADSYCRAVRLLTLEAPPQHRVLHRWVVEQLVLAGTALATDPAADLPASPPFRDRLLAELSTLEDAQRLADRAVRLYRVSAGLAGARTPEQVAEVVLAEGTAALDADRGVVLLLGSENRLMLAGSVGLGEVARRQVPMVLLTDRLPAAEAARTGSPVWVESLAERDRRYPRLAETEPESRSLVAIPLLAGDRCLGSLRFGFDHDLVVDPGERSFVLALAAQTASALDRSLAYRAENRARETAEQTAGRLARLQTVTSALAGTRDESEVAAIVLGHAVEALGASSGALCLLDDDARDRELRADDRLRLAHVVGLTPETQQRWSSFALDARVPAADAVRTGEPVVLPSRAERDRRYPQLAAGLGTEEHAMAAMPLGVGPRCLGALNLTFQVGRTLTGADVAFLSSLADACSQALDRAHAIASARAASTRLAFLADASVALSESLDQAATLARLARLAVPVLADWCTVALLDGGTLSTVAVAHVDPARAALARELEQRYPADPATAAGQRVLETGRAEIFPVVTDAQLEATAVDAEHARLRQELGLSSAMVVPMTARGRVLGVLSLISAESGRQFGPADLALAEDLARRAAVAVDTAALFRDLAAAQP